MDILLAQIDFALLTITTNEPVQDEVIAVRLDALNATPGFDFELSMVDKSGVTRTNTFPPGSDTQREILPPERPSFVLSRRRDPDGSIASVMVKPEYTFRRLEE